MFEVQIKAGAALLDEKVPEWLERQDLEKLSLNDSDLCVVGQAYPDRSYIDALMELFDTFDENEVIDMSTGYGFCIPGGVNYAEYPRLTEEWKAYIQDRRESTTTS